MRRRQAGSMTVEASILIPFMFFLLMAVIYLMFFLRDRTVLISDGLRTAERLAWAQDDEMTAMEAEGQAPVLMMETTDIQCTKADLVSEAVDLLKSRTTAQVHLEGHMTVGIPGSAAFIGSVLSTEMSLKAERIHYTEDRLRTVRKQKAEDE